MAEERRPAIHKEELFQAADDLVADGKRVTATALLDALGGGSLRTIYKYMTEWQQGQFQEPTNGQPTELPDSVLAAFKATWRAATAEADRATAAVREQAAEEVKAAEGKFTDALDVIERLESQADQDAQKIEELTAKIAEIETALRNSEMEKAGLAATTKQLENQIRSKESEIVRLQDDHQIAQERHKTENNKLNGALAEEKAEKEKLMSELASANKVIEKAQAQAQTADEKAAKNQEKTEKAIAEAAELRGKVEALTTQNKELLSRLKVPEPEKPKKK